jgi:mannose-P-dolichol utilization defect protein 1
MMSLSFLLKLPLFPQLAEFVWGAGGDDEPLLSAEHCMSDIFDSDCLVRLGLKLLGVAMIAGAFLNKAPIIANIVSKKSVAGLAKSSIYGELAVLTNCFLYGFLEGLPFTAYGENFALLLQTMVIIFFIWNYTKTSMPEMAGVTTIWVLYIYSIVTFLPLENTAILMRSLLPIVIYSKGSQIATIFQEKHTGNQSIITLTMNCVGTSIRVLTTIGEVGWNMDLLSGHAIGAILNYTLTVQYLYFKENTRVFWEKQESKKKE